MKPTIWEQIKCCFGFHDYRVARDLAHPDNPSFYRLICRRCPKVEHRFNP